MKKADRADLYVDALYLWDDRTQLYKLSEECAELIVAINNFLKKIKLANLYDKTEADQIKSTGEAVQKGLELMEEIADVEIMIEQARLMCGDGKINKFKDFKLNRLKNLIEKEKNEKSS